MIILFLLGQLACVGVTVYGLRHSKSPFVPLAFFLSFIPVLGWGIAFGACLRPQVASAEPVWEITDSAPEVLNAPDCRADLSPYLNVEASQTILMKLGLRLGDCPKNCLCEFCLARDVDALLKESGPA